MSEIELLYVENIIARKRGAIHQELTFCLRVRNLSHTKQVEVRWAGEDGIWETLPATYVASSGNNDEIWLAHAMRQASPTASLPGNIEFVCSLRAAGGEYWAKPEHDNYRCEADSGLRLGSGLTLLHVGYQPQLEEDQKQLTIDVAVNTLLNPQEVFVEWTDDGWRTRQRARCAPARDHWDKARQSNARNPNQYGVQLWTARLRVRDAYRIDYAIGCVTPAGTRWDNNRGNNYTARHAALRVLTLNLHCYQEENQDAKFSQIARAIADLGIDIVCFQEVAENWNAGQGDWSSNAARIINERLPHAYHLFTDWAHLGFDRYREGVAILSRFPLRYQEGRYVSTSHDDHNIHARKAVLAQVDIPHFGPVNVFSTHLSWWQDGFSQQFDTLVAWADSCHAAGVAATIICGDFNIKAGSEGYTHVIRASDYEDQYLKQSDRRTFDRVYRKRGPGAAPSLGELAAALADDHRIDYIWAKRGSRIKPVAARRLFLDTDYGRVSDHEGYLITFEATP